MKKFYKLSSKNHWSLRVGLQPIDFVSAAGSVRVPKNLISCIDVTTIDIGAD